MLDDIGAFDESFFAYLEDADVAWRARMGGWRCLYAPAAIVRHHHSSSLGHGSPAKHYLVGRNRVRMLAKNATSQQLIRSSPWILVYELAYVAFAVSTSFSFAPINGRVRGIVDWPTYRRAGARHRAAISLSPAQGLRRALNRHFEYEVER
jgi:GT2 family glycosyltransferase